MPHGVPTRAETAAIAAEADLAAAEVADRRSADAARQAAEAEESVLAVQISSDRARAQERAAEADLADSWG